MRLCGHGPSVRLHVTLDLDDDDDDSGDKKAKGAAAAAAAAVAAAGAQQSACYSPAQTTVAVEHLTQVRSPEDCRRVLEVAREMAERTAAITGKGDDTTTTVSALPRLEAA